MRDAHRDPARPAVFRPRDAPKGRRVRAVGGYGLLLAGAAFLVLVIFALYVQAVVTHALCGVEVAVRLMTMLAGHLPSFCKS